MPAITVGVRSSSSRNGEVVAVKFRTAGADTGAKATQSSFSGLIPRTPTSTGTGSAWGTATLAKLIPMTAEKDRPAEASDGDRSEGR